MHGKSNNGSFIIEIGCSGCVTLSEDLETMRLFHDKVDSLRRGDFARVMATQKTGLTFSGRQGEPLKLEIRGPSQDAIDAAVLHLRFFIQDNERISLHNMATVVERYQGRSDRVRLFLDCRTKLNQFLDSDYEPHIEVQGTVLKNRAVLEGIVYGERAHLNEMKRKAMAALRGVAPPVVSGIVDNAFNGILADFINALFYLQIQTRAIHLDLTSIELPISWPEEGQGESA